MKTKSFEAPKMMVLRLDSEDIIRTSGGCWESYDCQKCYAEAAVCDKYDCTGLVCSCLGSLHI